jgi:hypothetical protein
MSGRLEEETDMSRRTFMSLAAAASITTLFAAGCATTPPGAYVPLPEGTVSVYQRTSTGSYGTADGLVSWNHTSGTWQGRPALLAVSPQAGTNVMDPATHQLVAVLNTAGQPVNSFNPPTGPRYPLEVGQAYTVKSQMTLHARNTTVPYEVNYRVEAYESVTVPAGTFMAYRLRYSDNFGETFTVWSAPAQGIATVKRVLDRPATHPQGAGHLEGVLTSVKRPG